MNQLIFASDSSGAILERLISTSNNFRYYGVHTHVIVLHDGKLKLVRTYDIIAKCMSDNLPLLLSML